LQILKIFCLKSFFFYERHRFMTTFIEQVKTRTKILLRCAIKVGQDSYGNSYYESHNIFVGTPKNQKRWVLYKGIAEGSKVPGIWHAWLHFYGNAPLKEEADYMYTPNMTGSLNQRIPEASSQSSQNQYIPWKPE